MRAQTLFPHHPSYKGDAKRTVHGRMMIHAIKNELKSSFILILLPPRDTFTFSYTIQYTYSLPQSHSLSLTLLYQRVNKKNQREIERLYL